MRLIGEIFRKKGIDLSGKMLYREAVRGIILSERKLLMVYSSKDGDYKFPGGGVDSGEVYHDTLIREVKEECGATVNNIYSEFGKIIEYDKPAEEDYDVCKMISYYYVCDVDPDLGEQFLEEYERELGFQPVWIDIDSAIKANKALINSKNSNAPRWTRRETFVLELIKKKMLSY